MDIQANDGFVATRSWESPSEEMQMHPLFEAVRLAIKGWDINVPDAYSGYCGANGNHVKAIVDAVMVVMLQRRGADKMLPRSALEIEFEIMRARSKFPGPNNNFAALVEEVGELAKALMDCKPGDRESCVAVYKEATQVATMAIRVMEEGDRGVCPAYVAHLGMAL